MVEERAKGSDRFFFGRLHETQDHTVERFAGAGMEDAWEEPHLLLFLRQEGLEAAALVVLRQLERVADVHSRCVVTPRPERSESERQGAFIGEDPDGRRPKGQQKPTCALECTPQGGQGNGQGNQGDAVVDQAVRDAGGNKVK